MLVNDRIFIYIYRYTHSVNGGMYGREHLPVFEFVRLLA